ncbi:MAG: hypothetical protein AB1757_12390 [Acidobacteriota bacterium]
MKTLIILTVTAIVGLLSVIMLPPVPPVAKAQGNQSSSSSSSSSSPKDFVPPIVFQAAGPTVASIQSSVDAYRAALGANNGNEQGPRDKHGRREINWDGGSTTNQNTVVSANPFTGFQFTRGALFTTPDGTGFVQAPATADSALFPPGGMAGQFNNPAYATIFTAFSSSRLFSAIGGRITDVEFFVPGPNNGNKPAAVTGFSAVFTDVDQPDGSGSSKKRGNRKASTLVEYFAANGELLFSSFVPASPGDGSLSFLGIVFEDARIARVRITSGDGIPGTADEKQDIVMMDDFIYGEPQPLR